MATPDVKFTIGGDEKGFRTSLNNVEKYATNTGKRITSTFSAASAAIGAAISAWGVNELIDIADQYTLIDGRLGLVVDSTEELTKAQSDLYRVSQSTRQEYEQTATLYTNLSRATKDLNLSQNTLVDITETLNQALIVSGATQEESGNSMRQFNQAMMGGIVRAEEYNSMLENTPRVLEAVADGLGITMGQLREEMLASQLTSERFLQGLQNGSADVRAEFEKMPTTVDQALTTLENAFKDILSDANKASDATAGISGSILDLTETVESNKDNILSLLTGMVESGGWVIQIMSDIATEVKVMSAVAAGVLDVTDYLSMGMAEMRAWIDDFDAGIAGTLKNIAELQDKIADLESSPRADWAVNKEKINEYKAQLDNLYEELDRKQQAYADKSVKIEEEANSAKIVSARETTAALNDEQQKRLDAEKKALAAALKEREKIGRAMLKNGTSMAMYGKELSDNLAKYESDKNKQILSDLESYFKEEKDLYSDKNNDIITLQENLVNDLGQITSSFIDDVLTGEIDSIEDMFESLFDSIFSMFSRLIGQIAANSLIEALGFGGTGGLSIQGLISGSSGSGAAGAATSLAGGAYQAITGKSLLAAAGGYIGSLFGSGGVAGTEAAYNAAAFGPSAYQMAAETFIPSLTTTATEAATAAATEVAANVATETSSGIFSGLSGASALGVGAPLAALGGIIAGWASLSSPVYAGVDTGVGDNRLNVRDRNEDGLVSEWEVYKDMDSNIDAMNTYAEALETLEKGTNESGRAAIGAGSAQADLQEALTKSQLEIETMANVFGNQTAKMALNLDGTIPSFDKFVDAISGQDVSLQDSTRYHWLAKEAVDGTAGAADTLYDEMMALTGSAEQAQIATMGMIASINELSNTPLSIDVEVNQKVVSTVDSTAYMTGQASADDYVRSSSSMKKSTSYAAWDLSNHAVGGIYTKPTLLQDAYGDMHQVAEAGTAEAIIPLDNPRQISTIEQKVDAIVAALANNNITINHQTILDGKVVDSRVDKHIVARNQSGIDPLQRAVY